jgi:hypothetical protein
MLHSQDFKELLSLFARYSVRFLVIGGYAVMKYTEPRYTKDLDLLIATDPPNAEATFLALREFGAPLANLSPKDFTEEGYFYQMGHPPFRVDIMMSIPGVCFNNAWPQRNKITLDGVVIPFISKTDLLAA